MKFPSVTFLFTTLYYSNIVNCENIFGGRIVGGSDCPIVENPFMVSLKVAIQLRHKCGGTLLNSRWVLTAAHCVEAHKTRPLGLVVVAGVSYSRKKERQWSQARRIVIHSDYHDPMPLANDIALILLHDVIWESQTVRFVRLPDRKHEGDLDVECQEAKITGWGDRNPKPVPHRFASSTANHLQCAWVTVLKQVTCQRLYPDPVIDTAICALGSIKGDACHGDSGGPLLCHNVQQGIVSAGYGCAQNIPVIYTRVDQFLDFIWDNVNGNTRRKLSLYSLGLVFILIAIDHFI